MNTTTIKGKKRNMYKILVAEDNAINIKVAEFILKPIAEVLHFAMNGEEVLEKLKTNNYDVILMDVKMPIMDGYETTVKIRANEKEQGNKPLIIIATTANNQPEDIEKCKNVGMNDFVSKPFNTAQVKDIIENHLAQ